jgi:hypothetical protein
VPCHANRHEPSSSGTPWPRTALTHYSLARLYEQVIGSTPYLGNATTAPDMAAAFGLPVATRNSGAALK